MNESIYDISVTDISGKNRSIEEWKGKVLLIVNVASKCGFTPQYQGLEALHKKYADRGLVVMGFPCNQFGGQEPGSESEISDFCTVNFNVTFPLFAKVEVNGPGTHPLYAFLKSEKRGLLGTEGIKWNFTKFIVGRDGRVIDRFASTTQPQDLEQIIEAAITKPATPSTQQQVPGGAAVTEI